MAAALTAMAFLGCAIHAVGSHGPLHCWRLADQPVTLVAALVAIVAEVLAATRSGTRWVLFAFAAQLLLVAGLSGLVVAGNGEWEGTPFSVSLGLALAFAAAGLVAQLFGRRGVKAPPGSDTSETPALSPPRPSTRARPSPR